MVSRGKRERGGQDYSMQAAEILDFGHPKQ